MSKSFDQGPSYFSPKGKFHLQSYVVHVVQLKVLKSLVFLFVAENGMSTSEVQGAVPTNTTDSPPMTNHRLSDSYGEALEKACSVAKTPEETSSAQKVPLLPSTTVLTSGVAPTTVCGHLQLLFAQLQYSFRR